MKIQIVFPGLDEVKESTDLLEALEFVVANHSQHNFMIKVSQNEPWQDGAKMFRNFQRMFEPV